MVRVRAPKLPQTLPWLNCNRPLSLAELRGQIVLLDFWTYGCINCLHVIPDLHYLSQKYPESLTIISVHTAKFDQEHALSGIQQAIQRYGIPHPVLVDCDRTVWDHYAVRAYPTFVLIDPQGYVVTRLSGEGKRQILDELIQGLIDEHRGHGTLNQSRLDHLLQPQFSLTTPLAFPGKVLADPASNTLFIADTGYHRIVMTSLDGQLKAVVGTGQAGWQDGSWETAQFSAPQGMFWDAAQQRLYLSDAGNHLLRQIDWVQQSVSTLAGTGSQNRSLLPQSGQALEIALNSPWDLALVGNKIYIAMAGSHQIWVLNLENSYIQTFMGTGAEYCVDGAREVAAFAQPHGLSSNGLELFVADSETSSIRALTLEAVPLLRTLCGQGQLFGFGDQDGIGTEVQLQHCSGVAYGQGFLWVADTYNHKIKQVNPVTGECWTLVGGQTAGFQDGKGSEALFSEPSGLSLSGDRLYIADTNNHAIRCLDLDSLEVTTLSLPQLCSPFVCIPL